jgi:hypothetical protein
MTPMLDAEPVCFNEMEGMDAMSPDQEYTYMESHQ